MANQATVTYFYHSGFSVAVEDTLLIFDYWRGDQDALPESCQITPRDFEGFRQVLVFVSHDHEDHFDEIIYTWKFDGPVTYIVADDMPIGKRGKRVKPGDSLEIGGAEILVFSSTDKGVSYYVTIHGLHIFHAGDLNLWHWREESTLREIAQAENAFYAAVAPLERLPVDVAMFPVDPRMGGFYDAGANYFVMAVKPRLFIPMHWQGKPEVATSYARKGRTKYTEVLALTKPRERAEMTFEENELHIHIYSPPRDPLTGQLISDVQLNAYSAADPFSDTDLPVKI